MALASFSVTVTPAFRTSIAGQTWQFASAAFDPAGTAPDQNEAVEEALESVGVNNRRWRMVYRQYQPFILNTVSDSSTYAGAIALVQRYRSTIGSLGTLSVTLDSTVTKWKNVKVLGCIPQLRRGQLVGDGASSTSVGVIFTQWTMVLADATKSGTNST